MHMLVALQTFLLYTDLLAASEANQPTLDRENQCLECQNANNFGVAARSLLKPKEPQSAFLNRLANQPIPSNYPKSNLWAQTLSRSPSPSLRNPQPKSPSPQPKVQSLQSPRPSSQSPRPSPQSISPRIPPTPQNPAPVQSQSAIKNSIPSPTLKNQPQPPSNRPNKLPQSNARQVNCGLQATEFRPILGETRIVNGVEAAPHSWPWMATLLVQFPQGQGFCGGTLLRVRENVEASDILLTAAHCVVTEQGTIKLQLLPSSSFTVVAGYHNRQVQDRHQQQRSVDAVRMYPYFRFTNLGPGNVGGENDIAIVKLSQPIQFNEAIRPVCLPTKYAPIPLGRVCVTAGWGRNDNNNPNSIPDALQQLLVPLHHPSVCYRSWPGVYRELLMICGGSLNGTNGVCQGDSGGMMACRESDGRWFQYGIVSFGLDIDCLAPDKAFIWTRISSYMEWVDQAINELTALQG